METMTRPIISAGGRRTFDAGISFAEAKKQLGIFYAAQVLVSTGSCAAYPVEKITSVARWMCGMGKPSLMLYGSYGLGKTTMLNAVRYVMRLYSTTYVSPVYEAKFLCERGTDDYKRTFGLLIIDELGRESDRKNEFGNISEPLTDLLYWREKYALPTLIATNCTGDDLREKYGASIYDRFRSEYSKIFYNGESYRK